MLFSSFTEFRHCEAELEALRVAIEEALMADAALFTRIELVNSIVNAHSVNICYDVLVRILAGAMPPPPAPP